MPGLIDRFANSAYISCTESAAGTLTAQKLESGYSVLGNTGWIIHRLEYAVLGAHQLCNTTGDYAQVGLTALAAPSLTTFSSANGGVYDFLEIGRIDTGTAANANFVWSPYVKDFSNLPGGGLLVAPNPLYLAVKGTGLSAALNVNLRIFFTEIELDPDLYRELFQSRALIA